MIPQTIQLKNFLSYGPTVQSIDFAPYHLICLNGKNGHGKSALLDAITWALWGSARKISGTSKPDAHLLRLGQTNMMVIFDFIFNGQHYRIRREYSEQNGKPHAALDFVLVDAATKKVTPLTDKTIRGTQQKIESLLHLDFDTFVNSAFLRQGQANEFSKKTPKERKDILAAILNLGTYEELRTATAGKMRVLQNDTIVLEQLITRLQEQISQKNIHAELLTLADSFNATELSIQELQKKINTYQSFQMQAAMIDQHSALTQEQIQRSRREQDVKTKELLNVFHQWRRIHREQRKTVDIKELMHTLELKKKAIAQMQHNYQKRLNHQQQYITLKENQRAFFERTQTEVQQLEKVKHQELNELSSLNQQAQISLEHLKKLALDHVEKKQHLEKNINELYLQLASSKSKLTTKEIIEKQFEKRKKYYHRWASDLQSLKNELQQIDQKETTASDVHNPSCPWCDQHLSAARKRFLYDKLCGRKKNIEHSIDRLMRILPTLKKLLQDQHSELAELIRIENSAVQLQQQIEFFKKELNVIELQAGQTQNEIELQTAQNQSLNQQLQDLQKNFININDRIKQTLDASSEYQFILTSLENEKKLIEEVPFDQNAYLGVLKEVETAQAALDCQQNVLQEIHNQQERLSSFKTSRLSIKELKKHCHSYNAIAEQYQKQKIQLLELVQDKNSFVVQLAETEKQRHLLLQKKAQLEHEELQKKSVLDEIETHQKKIAEHKGMIAQYQALVDAFGKDGIQALLIEDVLPEIEYEANLILAQLTHNQAHIIIDSLRDLKKGGTKETLDIKISDPLGIRPYEMFSGGEAFRIDFALRIAISKLLARRAGTSLQTLIIDEGFGSQDDEGIAHISDVLYKIQDHFEKIIIVSHLPSMKDHFPVHFHIQKEAQGSTVTVRHQG